MLTMVVMDSGLTLRAPRNDDGESFAAISTARNISLLAKVRPRVQKIAARTMMRPTRRPS
jgi:hypothetical protein